MEISNNYGSKPISPALRNSVAGSYGIIPDLPRLGTNWQVELTARIAPGQQGYLWSVAGTKLVNGNIMRGNTGVITGFAATHEFFSADYGDNYPAIINRTTLSAVPLLREQVYKTTSVPGVGVTNTINGVPKGDVQPVQDIYWYEDGFCLGRFLEKATTKNPNAVEYLARGRYDNLKITINGVLLVDIDFEDGLGRNKVSNQYHMQLMNGAVIYPDNTPAAPANLIVNNFTRLATWDGGNTSEFEYEFVADAIPVEGSGLEPSTLRFTSAPLYNDFVSETEPAAFRQAEYSFANGAPAAGSVLHYTDIKRVSPIQFYQAEGPAFTRLIGDGQPWSVDPRNPHLYPNNLRGAFSGAGVSAPAYIRLPKVKRAELRAPTSQGLDTIVMRPSLNGTLVGSNLAFFQKGPDSPAVARPELTKEFDVAQELELEIFGFQTAGNSGFCAFDGLWVDSGESILPTFTTVAPTYSGGALRLQANGNIRYSKLSVGPIGPWYAASFEVPERPTAVGGNATVYYGKGDDQFCMEGIAYHTADQTLQMFSIVLGVPTFGAEKFPTSGLPLPWKMTAVNTGSMLSLLFGAQGQDVTKRMTWEAADDGQDFHEISRYEGDKAGKYMVMLDAPAGVVLDAAVSLMRGGYFGSTATCDNGLLNQANGKPIIENGKLFFNVTDKGYYFPGVVNSGTMPIQKLLQNSVVGTLALDLPSLEASYADRVANPKPLVTHSGLAFFDSDNRRYGEGSAGIVWDEAAQKFRSSTPRWHDAVDESTKNVRMMNASTTDNVRTGVGVFRNGTIIVPDPANPLQVTNDSQRTQIDADTWSLLYTAKIDGQNRLWPKMVHETNLDGATTYQVVMDEPGLAKDYYEGGRVVWMNGKAYGPMAGHSDWRFYDMVTGAFAFELPMPQELLNQEYSSHFCGFEHTFPDGKTRFVILAFTSDKKDDKRFGNGKLLIYVSDQFVTA